jgi:hypothetical protein
MVVRLQPIIVEVVNFDGCAIEPSLWSCTERDYYIASIL